MGVLPQAPADKIKSRIGVKSVVKSPPISASKLEHLVVDSGAIIKGIPLENLANNLWTVEDVLSEVKDKRSRHLLAKLPVELKCREPSMEALKFVATFARKTGDLRSLSNADMKVLALTYMLEKECNGVTHLRTEPTQGGSNGGKVSNTGIRGMARVASLASEKNNSTNNTEVNFVFGLNLIVRNLHEHVTEDTLQRTFAPFGAITSVCVMRSKNGRSRRFGFVSFQLESSAQSALKNLDGLVLLGKAIKVALWKPRKELPEQNTTITNDVIVATSENLQTCCTCDSAVSKTSENVKLSDSHATKTVDVASKTSQDSELSDNHTTKTVDAVSKISQDLELQSKTSKTSKNKLDLSQTETKKEDVPNTKQNFLPTKSTWAKASTSTSTQKILTVPANKPEEEMTALEKRIARKKAKKDAIRVAAKEKQSIVDASAVSEAEKTAAIETKKYQSRIVGKIDVSMIKTVILNADEEAEDDIGWIAPGDGSTAATTGQGWGRLGSQFDTLVAGKTKPVGCITTDFAMQNILLQVGLNLLSANGMVIRRLKQWVLRCDGCFTISKDTNRLFCDKCGGDSLRKLAVTVNKDGTCRYHFNSRHINQPIRGCKYSIPKAKGGRAGMGSRDLLLRGDQLRQGDWRLKAGKKDELKSMFGADVVHKLGLVGRVGVGASVTVGMGRYNPNARRGRERRGAKKKKDKTKPRTSRRTRHH